jgi:hypothetical protein
MIRKIFFLFILIPWIAYAMEQESSFKKIENPIQLKQTIRENIGEIEKLLSNQRFTEIADSKNWFILLADLKENVDPSKKRVLDDIATFFRQNKFYKEMEPAYNALDKIKELPNALIQSKIIEYFQDISKIGKILDIRKKPEGKGVQFGAIVDIETKLSNIVQFYVKTHQNGLLSQTMNTTVKPVDLKELFAYKFLELCGISPEVHFFYDDEKYFYIATKNDGYSQDGSVEFITYENAKKEVNFYNNNADLISSSFFLTDMYSRILDIGDVLTNSSNIGFIKVKQNHFFAYEYNYFRIIDFRTPSTRSYYKINNIYKGWISGNNQYNYEDVFVVNLLKNKNIKEKKEKIIPLLKEVKVVEKNVEDAFTFVDNIAKKIYEENTYKGNIEDLKTYRNTVREHYNDLYQGIVNNQETLNFTKKD